MKIVISEGQYERLIESEEEEKVLRIPSLKIFDDNWDMLQKFLELKGNPPYTIGHDLYLRETPIKSLGNLISVGGNLNLWDTSIESLGNLTSVGGNLILRDTQIKSLGNLTSVGGSLDLSRTPIKSLGNLTSVGGDLDLINTSIESIGNLTHVGNSLYLRRSPLSKKYTGGEQIRQMVDVGGNIYF
jgi:hypothetical protein